MLIGHGNKQYINQTDHFIDLFDTVLKNNFSKQAKIIMEIIFKKS